MQFCTVGRGDWQQGIRFQTKNQNVVIFGRKINNTMTTQESSQQTFPLYYFFSPRPARQCHCIIFFVGMMPDAIVLFFSCCRCIIFRGLPAKGKRNVHPNFAKILVLGRLGCVIVLFFSAGPAWQCHCIIFSRAGQLANPIVLFIFGPVRPGWAIVLFFFGAGKIK